MNINIDGNLSGLIYHRAKREGKKFELLVNELLSSALWNEPSQMFRGRKCQVNPDLFGTIKPLEEVEDDPRN